MTSNPTAPPPLELWGGVECTINRVGDAYYDQFERNGHADRLDDLDRFADLGVRALRYSVLWERTAPNGVERADWHWADERMGRLRELRIRPIVGLVHHGSGPRHTSLVDPAFPDGLARFARAVAERYPWVEDFTPVNEPLTTARFSGLYGHWYPHGRDGLTFARALVTQCRAVALAMQAIREVTPTARLIQTEDLGKVFATPKLAYQATFENDRRWLSFDLLCGRVDRHHPMWEHLRWLGIAEAELTPFLEAPCPPDVFGVNHYLTSERFLDERLDRYPVHTHGRNSRHAYADVEAVRVLADGLAGPAALLRETWERYRRPIAVTEAHLGCTREEQLRWLKQVWDGAQHLRSQGADVRAVTVWSLLGAYDWDSLLTRWDGHYEPGVFDLRAPRPRPTALARLARDLAAGQTPDHPVLGVPGWWIRPDRLLYPPVGRDRHASPADTHDAIADEDQRSRGRSVPPILITGADGALGDAFARVCDGRCIPYRLLAHEDLEVKDSASVEAALIADEPWAVIDAGGPDRLTTAATGAGAALRTYVDGQEVLAAACARRGIPFVTFSSAAVFDGSHTSPYVESDPVAPLDALGQAAAEAERRVLAVYAAALVVRTGPLFGPWDAANIVTTALRALAHGEPFPTVDDRVASPTYIPDLVDACLDLLIDGERGIWHLANPGAITLADLIRRAAERAGLNTTSVVARPRGLSRAVASNRPSWVLGSERGWLLQSVEDALDCFGQERDPALTERRPVTVATADGVPHEPTQLELWTAEDILRQAS